MSAMTPVAKDSPLYIAWEKYKATDEYANTKKWALFNEHVDGSLWAAFMNGFNAASPPATAKDRMSERVIELEKFNVWLATENENLRDLLRQTSSLMHQWDQGLDTYDGEDYEKAIEEWDRLLPLIDAELAKTDLISAYEGKE